MRVANDSGDILTNFSSMMNMNPHEIKNKAEMGSLENGEVTKFYFQKLLRIEYALAFTITTSMFLIITASQIKFNSAPNQKRQMVVFCLIFNCVNSIIAILITIMRSQAILNLDKKRKAVYLSTTLFSTKRIAWLIIEIIGILIQPYPFFIDSYFQTTNSLHHYTFLFPLNDLLSILSLSRAYIIFRGILSMTTYMNNRSNRLCKMYGSKSDYQFALKCLFKDNPLKLIMILFCVSSFIFGYAVFLAERNYSQSSNLTVICESNSVCTFTNALWLIFMTVTTVGYGDYFPQTPLGRLIIFLVAIWGTFIVSIMVVVVSNTLKMQKKEKQASLVIKKLSIRQKLKPIAGKFIGYSFLKKKARREGNQKNIQKYEAIVKTLKKQFSILRKQLRLLRNQMDLYDQIASNFLNLNNDIDILNQNQDNIIKFIHENLQYKQKTPYVFGEEQDKNIIK